MTEPLNVRKISHPTLVQLDTDGTPMVLGERLIEVRPGEWMTPLGAALSAEVFPDLEPEAMDPVTVTAYDPQSGEHETQILKRDGYVLILGQEMVLHSDTGHGTGTIVLTIKRREPCPNCLGDKQIADSEDGERWSAWANLPPGSDLAVRTGMVKPITCPECNGTGTKP